MGFETYPVSSCTSRVYIIKQSLWDLKLRAMDYLESVYYIIKQSLWDLKQ